MPLIAVNFDYEDLSFRCADPIKTFYIVSETELIPNDNYYICLQIGRQIISFTNQFKKVMIDGMEVYELSLFANQLTLPMHLITNYFYNRMALSGWKDPWIADGQLRSKQIEHLTNIYYEKDEQLTNYHDYQELIIYNHSPLSQQWRSLYPLPADYKKLYGESVDNVFRIMNGMCVKVYCIN